MEPTLTGNPAAPPIQNKIAALTVSFWIMKIAATTLGETAGDLLSKTLHVGYALSTVILLSVFLVTVVIQFRVSRYHPLLFWTVILSTSTAGTTLSDFMDRTLGLGYAKGSLILVTGLIATLVAWRLTEKSLSVSDVKSPRAEAFYWTAILFSNTLGTALGDYLADDSGLGFGGSAFLIGALLLLNLLLYRFTRLNRVALFWLAFVLTRPFGATFGDLLARPREEHCLGFGTAGSSLVLAAILAVFVVRAHLAEQRSRLAVTPA